MKQFSFFLFVLTCLIACNSKPKNNCKPYFEFDAIEHYSIIISLKEEIKLLDRDSLSAAELRLNDVLFQPKRTRLADTIDLIRLEEIGFKKKIVESSKFEIVNSVFCFREHGESLSTACDPVYRDVLIFKKRGQIIGTAKICFHCNYHVIAGASVNTDGFGQSGDYKKLYHLLY
jgi:hypothetical protein